LDHSFTDNQKAKTMKLRNKEYIISARRKNKSMILLTHMLGYLKCNDPFCAKNLEKWKESLRKKYETITKLRCSRSWIDKENAAANSLDTGREIFKRRKNTEGPLHCTGMSLTSGKRLYGGFPANAL
jgi:hypothetical protein